MMTTSFTISDIQGLMEEYCADWVKRLDLKVVDFDQESARFVWTGTDELLRQVEGAPPIMSGQAIMAVADTATFMTVCAINGRFRSCTTIDLHTNFLRPLGAGQVDLTVTAVANGRRTATLRSEFRAEGSPKVAATATAAFMYLD